MIVVVLTLVLGLPLLLLEASLGQVTNNTAVVVAAVVVAVVDQHWCIGIEFLQ